MFHFAEGEKKILVVRKHWLVFFGEGVIMLIVMLIPLALYLFVPWFSENFSIFMFMASLWLLFSWMILFIMWTHNYLDILVITDRRIIDIEQRTLFSRHTSSLHLEQLEDVTVEVHGFLGTIFNYGDIHVQSAGESREIAIYSVPDPERIRKIIADGYERAVRNIPMTQKT